MKLISRSQGKNGYLKFGYVLIKPHSRKLHATLQCTKPVLLRLPSQVLILRNELKLYKLQLLSIVGNDYISPPTSSSSFTVVTTHCGF